MKKSLLLLALSITLFATSCTKSTTPPDEPPLTSGTVEVSGDISTNTTWTADKIYTLKGFVYVTNGATLTINAGTIIKGDKASKGTLIITRGAKISAVGEVSKPIVFTSSFAAGTRNSGDWGGIILLGKAPVNQGGNVQIEGGLDAKGDAAKYIQYGGTDVNDNSGTLKYVRIEYAGIPFSPDNEINGLTLGGVGAGTTIDYVEVYRAGDDAYEWYGGTVNAKHLLAIGTLDDDFDVDFGFAGKVQYGLAQRFNTLADVSGSNGFETDNDGSGSNLAPQTSGIFSNMTIIGPYILATTPNISANHQHAAQIRRNSALSIFNSIFAGFAQGIYIDDSKVVTPKATSTNYIDGRLVFAHNIVYGMKTNETKGENLTVFDALVRANNTFSLTLYGGAVVTDPYKYSSDFANAGTPNFTVKAGSIAETGAVFTHAKVATDTFFDKVAYRGAFGTTNWASGWANFDPQTMPYTTPGAVN